MCIGFETKNDSLVQKQANLLNIMPLSSFVGQRVNEKQDISLY